MEIGAPLVCSRGGLWILYTLGEAGDSSGVYKQVKEIMKMEN